MGCSVKLLMATVKLQKETTSSGNRHGRWYDDACGTAFAMEVLGERWSLLVVRELLLGGRRFSELRRALAGISAKVLSERLENLERTGAVQRTMLPPPVSAQVYELTPWGYAAEPAIQELGRWAAQSELHDPTLPLSPVSLMISFRTMLDRARARQFDLRVGFDIAGETVLTTLADGELTHQRGPISAAQLISGRPPRRCWRRCSMARCPGARWPIRGCGWKAMKRSRNASSTCSICRPSWAAPLLSERGRRRRLLHVPQPASTPGVRSPGRTRRPASDGGRHRRSSRCRTAS